RDQAQRLCAGDRHGDTGEELGLGRLPARAQGDVGQPLAGSRHALPGDLVVVARPRRRAPHRGRARFSRVRLPSLREAVMAAVEAVGLCKSYGDVTAVDRLDLTIERGEIFGL